MRYVTGLLSVTHPAPCNCQQIRPDGECITELRLAQAWALFELSTVGGVLGGIGVGHGKTLLGILAPMMVKDCNVALLLCPPNLVGQLVTEYKLARNHFRVPSLAIENSSRRYYKAPGDVPTLHVLPYSLLCRKTHTDFLPRVNADFIMADECHKLKDPETATTSRMIRYLSENPSTRFAGWTGSLTDKSLTEYAHLSSWALREGSPLPLKKEIVESWALAIDPIDMKAPAGALLKFCDVGERVEHGFHRRLAETPGVILTKKSAIDAALVLTKRRPPVMPETVKAALESVRNFVRPDGEELVEAMEVAKCAREVACGFYYRWTFPNGEDETTIRRWLSVRKDWNKELRTKLQPRLEYLDSPLLCEEAAERFLLGIDPECCPNCNGGREPLPQGCARCFNTGRVKALPVWESEYYELWQSVKDTVNPVTVPVRFSDYLAADAARWGHANRGVIWYSYTAFGEWVAELSGLPLHGGGPNCAAMIAKEDGSRSIVASIKAHGTGRDGLQRLFDRQLICNVPSSATTWEQLLGRLHRLGQKSETVTGEVYCHTDELRASLMTAMNRSLYVQTTLGADQKLQQSDFE